MGSVVVELSGDERKLLAAFQKIQAAQLKTDEGLKKIQDTSKGAAKANEGTFGQQALSAVKNYAGGMMSVSVAVGAVGSALREARQEAIRAIAGVDALADSRRRLLQVSRGDWQGQVTESDKLAMQAGISRDAAQELMFAARSENFETSAAFLANTVGANVISMPAAIASAGKVRNLFPGAGLTAEQVVGGTMVAAQRSNLDYEALSAALPVAAEGAALAGSSPAETMGVLSALAGRFSSGESGAARMRAFATFAAIRPDMAGEGMLSALDKMQAMSDQERQKLLGSSQELNVAYGIMSEMEPVIRERVAAIQTEMARQTLIPALTAEALDPTTQVGMVNRGRQELMRAKAEGEIMQEQVFAEQGFQREAGLERYRAGQLTRGRDFWTRSASGMAASAAADANLPAGGIEAAGRVTEELWSRLNIIGIATGLAQTIQEWRQGNRELRDAADGLRDGTAQQQRAAQQLAE